MNGCYMSASPSWKNKLFFGDSLAVLRDEIAQPHEISALPNPHNTQKPDATLKL